MSPTSKFSTRMIISKVSLNKLLIYVLLLSFVYLSMSFFYELYVESSSTSKSSGLLSISDPTSLLEFIESSDDYVLVFFEQEFCRGCEIVRPAIRELAQSSYSSRLVIVSAHIDEMLRVDPKYTLKLLSRLGIPGTPTVVVYKGGLEVGRHVGIFVLYQYTGLVKFVERVLTSSESSYLDVESLNSSSFTPLSIAVFGLGFMAALSPCSLPLVVIYGATMGSKGRDRSTRKILVSSFLGLFFSISVIGLATALLYVVSLRLPLNLFVVFISVISSFIMVVGLRLVKSGEFYFSTSSRATSFLPVLGLQCSLPFLLVVVGLVASFSKNNIITAIILSTIFSTGFILPYLLALATSTRFVLFLDRITRLKMLGRFQGLLLILISLYLYYEYFGGLLN